MVEGGGSGGRGGVGRGQGLTVNQLMCDCYVTVWYVHAIYSREFYPYSSLPYCAEEKYCK